jgi:methylenetetrahydrofolate reductase (NADPH)
MRAAHNPDAASFVRKFSLEATRPRAAEIAALGELLPPATPVYLTAVPTAAPSETAATASLLRQAGFEPVVHVAARRLKRADSLSELLNALRGDADVRRLLVIGGDVDAAGPFTDALAVIQKGRLREAGIEEIGIGAYPEGHPRIAPGRLEASLDEKIASATAQGLRVHIVSQFSFSAERIIAWLKQLRSSGITLPVKIGLAGPTSVPALIRYARRCGVNASLRGLMSGAASGLIGNVGPDRIIELLSAALDEIGDAHPHYYSFGGLVETARYAREAARAEGAAQHAAPSQ